MKRLIFCIIATLALSFCAQQANAQYLEGDCVMEFNGERVPGGDISWEIDLPTIYYYVDITVKSYIFTDGQLVERPWFIADMSAPELHKTKIGNNTLRISFNENPGRQSGCVVSLLTESGGGGHFWVKLPLGSY